MIMIDIGFPTYQPFQRRTLAAGNLKIQVDFPEPRKHPFWPWKNVNQFPIVQNSKINVNNYTKIVSNY